MVFFNKKATPVNLLSQYVFFSIQFLFIVICVFHIRPVRDRFDGRHNVIEKTRKKVATSVRGMKNGLSFGVRL